MVFSSNTVRDTPRLDELQPIRSTLPVSPADLVQGGVSPPGGEKSKSSNARRCREQQRQASETKLQSLWGTSPDVHASHQEGERNMSRATEQWNKVTEQLRRWRGALPEQAVMVGVAVAVIVAFLLWAMLR